MASKAPASSKDAKPADEAKPTDYVVLVEDAHEDDQTGRDVVWRPVIKDGKPHIFSARGGDLAIEMHAGKAGEAKAKPGRYKSVAWSSWKGITDIPAPVQVPQQKPTIITDE
jgi:hypothetical protein